MSAGEHGFADYQPDAAEKGPAPRAVAERILEARRLVADDSGTVFEYDGGAWQALPDIRLDQLALEAEPEFSTGHRRREIIGHLRARCYRGDLRWGRVADFEVPCKNGIVDVRTGALRDHAPHHYLERLIPHAYDPAAECPTWHEAIALWFGDGEGDGSVEALQEFMGYVCLPHAKFKKALMLYGRPDSGKSVIVAVMQALVGSRVTCQLSVEHMDDPTRRAVIKGKALNIMTELPASAMISDAGFKTLVSTEEPILLDQKYRPAEMYTPTAKHVIATNVLPRVDDRTEATFNRILLIPMRRSLSGEEQDRQLLAKLKGELEGILAWSLQGGRRLVERGGDWVVPEAGLKLLKQLREESNPIVQFLLERTVDDDTVGIPLTALTREINAWHGGRRFTARKVGALLRDAGHGDALQRLWVQGKQYRGLVGRRLVYETAPDFALLGEGDVGA